MIGLWIKVLTAIIVTAALFIIVPRTFGDSYKLTTSTGQTSQEDTTPSCDSLVITTDDTTMVFKIMHGEDGIDLTPSVDVREEPTATTITYYLDRNGNHTYDRKDHLLSSTTMPPEKDVIVYHKAMKKGRIVKREKHLLTKRWDYDGYVITIFKPRGKEQEKRLYASRMTILTPEGYEIDYSNFQAISIEVSLIEGPGTDTLTQDERWNLYFEKREETLNELVSKINQQS